MQSKESGHRPDGVRKVSENRSVQCFFHRGRTSSNELRKSIEPKPRKNPKHSWFTGRIRMRTDALEVGTQCFFSGASIMNQGARGNPQHTVAMDDDPLLSVMVLSIAGSTGRTGWTPRFFSSNLEIDRAETEKKTRGEPSRAGKAARFPHTVMDDDPLLSERRGRFAALRSVPSLPHARRRKEVVKVKAPILIIADAIRALRVNLPAERRRRDRLRLAARGTMARPCVRGRRPPSEVIGRTV